MFSLFLKLNLFKSYLNFEYDKYIAGLIDVLSKDIILSNEYFETSL